MSAKWIDLGPNSEVVLGSDITDIETALDIINNGASENNESASSSI